MQRFKTFLAEVLADGKRDTVEYWSLYAANSQGNIIDAGRAYYYKTKIKPQNVKVLSTKKISYEKYKEYQTGERDI